MLEELIDNKDNLISSLKNVKIAMRHHKEKYIVKQKFIEYLEKYDDSNFEPDVGDKMRHREIIESYCKYLNKDERRLKR